MILAVLAVLAFASAGCSGSGGEPDDASAVGPEVASESAVPASSSAPETTRAPASTAAPETAAPATSAVPDTEPPAPEPDGVAQVGFVDLGDGIDYVDPMAAGSDGVWVSVLGDRDDESAMERAVLFDPATASILLDAVIPARSGDIAASDGAAWVFGFVDGNVTRVDAATAETIVLPDRCAVAADGDQVWVAGLQSIERVDDVTTEPLGLELVIDDPALVVEESPLFDLLSARNDPSEIFCVEHLAVSSASVWAGWSDAGIFRFDASTGAATRFDGIPGSIEWVDAAVDGLWVLFDDRDVDELQLRFLPAEADAAVEDVSLEPYEFSEVGQLTADGTSLFFDARVEDQRVVVVVDTTTGSIVDVHEVASTYGKGVAVVDGRIFVSAEDPYGVLVLE